jgi:linoleate 10R-lipoxygenase
MLSGDKPSNTAQREFIKEKMYRPDDTLTEVREFYEKTTAKLIKQNARKLGSSYQIDIVQEYAPRTDS